jgi:hypothetical protein
MPTSRLAARGKAFVRCDSAQTVLEAMLGWLQHYDSHVEHGLVQKFKLVPLNHQRLLQRT